MVNLRHRFLATILFTTLVVYSAFAQSTLTQILDTIHNPDGTTFNGTVVITWNGFSGSGGGSVSRVSVSARVFNGALSVFLAPTTTAAPGSYYQVAYTSSNGLVTYNEAWQVPPSPTPLMVSQVRVSSTSGGGSGSGPGVQYATLPIAISQVTNLSADLSLINGSVTSLTSQVNDLATTVASTGSIMGLQTTVNNLSATVTSQGTTVSGLNSAVAALSSAVTANSTTLTGLSSTVSGLSSTVSGHTNSISTLTSNLSTLTSTVSGQTTSLTSLNTSVGGLNTSVTNLGNSLTGLTTTVNALSTGGSNAVFVDAETPAGTTNGTNTAFTLANPPAPTTSLTLFRNGILQQVNFDFTLSGSAITFAAGSVPQADDYVRAYYRTPGTGTATDFNDAELPSGTINGTNLTFTLAATPSPAASLTLFKNGVLLTQGADYVLSAATVTFANTTVAPQAGDSLTASYRH
jgi:uncharacterized protein YoxC